MWESFDKFCSLSDKICLKIQRNVFKKDVILFMQLCIKRMTNAENLNENCTKKD